MSEINPTEPDLTNSGFNLQQSEMWFLGLLIQRPEKLMDIKVSEKHFTAHSNRLIFSAVQKLERENSLIDVVTVAEELDKTEKNHCWLATLGHYVNEAFEHRFFESVQNVILDHYRRREVVIIANKLKNDFDASAAITALMSIDVCEKNYQHTIAQAAVSAIEKAQESAKKDGVTGLPSGLRKFDDAVGGFQKSDLYVFGARPAMGKTSVILNFMLNHSDQPTAFFSTEQPYDQIGLRAISAGSSVSARKIRIADFDQNEMNSMSAAAFALAKSKINIYDKGNLTLSELMREARRLKYNLDIQAVYVDYIQRIKTGNKERRLEVAEVVTGLKSLARELDIPVIALAQVNRSVEQKTNKRPRMGDLLESGVIEQEADLVALLYRDEVYNPENGEKGTIEILIDKNRHGPTGMLKFAWLPETMQIKDLYESAQIAGY